MRRGPSLAPVRERRCGTPGPGLAMTSTRDGGFAADRDDTGLTCGAESCGSAVASKASSDDFRSTSVSTDRPAPGASNTDMAQPPVALKKAPPDPSRHWP